MTTLRWGILSTAKIATHQVIPALQQSQYCEVHAISSRDGSRASAAASALHIPKAYSSYEALLADPDIDVIYNPLPNHLHVPWTEKALQAGKHVLCEKPLALTALEARSLLDMSLQYPDLRVMEAFMYRFHPQWIKAKALVLEGALGDIRAIHSFFSYFNDQPDNIRNQAAIGGGGLMDIGCYCLSFARFLLDEEPSRVVGLVNLDPVLQIDRVTSGLLDFSGAVQCTFTCSTQLAPYQTVNVFGTAGRLEILLPANPPAGGETKMILQLTGAPPQEIPLPAANHYTLQGDAFVRAILDRKPAPTPLSDAVRNMQVIDALFLSGKEGRWVTPQQFRP